MTAPDSPAFSSDRQTPEWAMILALAAVSVGLRLTLALMPLNRAEYTDGILQLTLFSQGNPYWPPLYSALAVGLGSLLGDAELGGRLVSALLGGLCIIPLCLIAHRLGGRRAASLAGIIFLVLPEPLRWGIRVMTDATFLTLFATCILLLMPDEKTCPIRRLVWATAFAVLATLTRYQGLILAFPILYAILQRLKNRQTIWQILLAQIFWLAIPLWMFRGGFAHLRQFADRSGADLGLTTGQTLLAYWNLAESYIYLFPYSISFGVFLAFVGGVFLLAGQRTAASIWTLGMMFFIGIVLLAMQAAFGIFEFRYMMPMLIFVVPCAGVGLQKIDESLANWRMVALSIFCVVLIPPMLLSAGSLLLQREVFADIRDASQYAGRIAGPQTRLYTNEHYNAEIPVVKTQYWAGRPVEYDPEFVRFTLTRMDPMNPPPPVPAAQRFRLGDLIIFNTIYAGPPPAEVLYLSHLGEDYEFDVVAQFVSSVTPLLTDVMEVPGAHGSPLAWFYRYSMQGSQTLVLKITKIHEK